jgi:hypothetical protein
MKKVDLVKIDLSRHAKRRARLYGIPESTIKGILAAADLSEGEHEIIKHVPGFGYPLKIVASVTRDGTTVITNYPLKKGRKK